MRLILLIVLVTVATQLAPLKSQPTSKPGHCEIGLIGEAGKVASREQVFARTKLLRDCLRNQVRPDEKPPQPHPFWLGLLGFVLIVGSGFILVFSFQQVAKQAIRDRVLRIAAVCVALCAALAVGSRLFLTDEGQSRANFAARRAAQADWQWQVDIARAAQIEDAATSIDEALDATERLIDNHPEQPEP